MDNAYQNILSNGDIAYRIIAIASCTQHAMGSIHVVAYFRVDLYTIRQ